MDPSIVELVLAMVIVPVLGVSFVGKALSFGKFRGVLESTYGLEGRISGIAAPTVLAVEFATAILLFVPPLRWVGFVIASAFFLGAALSSAAVLATGRNGDCGCFGALRAESLSEATVVRATILCAMAMAGATLHFT